MRARPTYLVVALLLLVGCSLNPTVGSPTPTIEPVDNGALDACNSEARQQNVDGAYRPLVNSVHLVEKVVVVDDRVPLYQRPNLNSTIENTVPVWTYFDVFDHEQGFCWVGLPGNQPIGWVAGEHLRPWTHLVAARLKPDVQPGQVPFFKIWPTSGQENIRAWNDTPGDRSTIPFPLIDVYPDDGPPEAYKVLHLIRSLPDRNQSISAEGWVTPEHFDLEVYATKQSLREVIEATNSAAIQLRSGTPSITQVLLAMLQGQGVSYNGPPIGVLEYSSICGQLPLAIDTPLTIRQDRETKEHMAEEFEESAALLNEFLQREENWNAANGGAWIPVAYLPSFESDHKYASCQ